MKDLLELTLCPADEGNECIGLEKLPLAYSYVPYQQYDRTYSTKEALSRGTVFPQLDKPMSVYGSEFMQTKGVRTL